MAMTPWSDILPRIAMSTARGAARDSRPCAYLLPRPDAGEEGWRLSLTTAAIASSICRRLVAAASVLRCCLRTCGRVLFEVSRTKSAASACWREGYRPGRPAGGDITAEPRPFVVEYHAPTPASPDVMKSIVAYEGMVKSPLAFNCDIPQHHQGRKCRCYR